jgi:hypothetical protein
MKIGHGSNSGIQGFREFRNLGIQGFRDLGIQGFRQLSIQFCAKSAKHFSVSL